MTLSPLVLEKVLELRAEVDAFGKELRAFGVEVRRTHDMARHIFAQGEKLHAQLKGIDAVAARIEQKLERMGPLKRVERRPQ